MPQTHVETIMFEPQPDDGDAFDSFRCKGTIDGTPFEAIFSLERDGRDVEILNVHGSMAENWEAQITVMEEIARADAWKASRIFHGTVN